MILCHPCMLKKEETGCGGSSEIYFQLSVLKFLQSHFLRSCYDIQVSKFAATHVVLAENKQRANAVWLWPDCRKINWARRANSGNHFLFGFTIGRDDFPLLSRMTIFTFQNCYRGASELKRDNVLHTWLAAWWQGMGCNVLKQAVI